jgi:hypothetical protein
LKRDDLPAAGRMTAIDMAMAHLGKRAATLLLS